MAVNAQEFAVKAAQNASQITIVAQRLDEMATSALVLDRPIAAEMTPQMARDFAKILRGAAEVMQASTQIISEMAIRIAEKDVLLQQAVILLTIHSKGPKP